MAALGTGPLRRPTANASILRSPACVIAAVLLGFGAEGCGGEATSSTVKQTNASAPTTSTATRATAIATTTSPTAPVGPVHATLIADDHAPIVNRPWPYSISVTDARGTPLSGTLEMEFVLLGQVVGRDTPPTHRITHGRWHDLLKFPVQAVGFPLIVQAVVHTSLGSATLDWPVKVRR